MALGVEGLHTFEEAAVRQRMVSRIAQKRPIPRDLAHVSSRRRIGRCDALGENETYLQIKWGVTEGHVVVASTKRIEMLAYDRDPPVNASASEPAECASTTVISLRDSTAKFTSLGRLSPNGLTCVATTEEIIFLDESGPSRVLAAWQHHRSSESKVKIGICDLQQQDQTVALAFSTGDLSVLEFSMGAGMTPPPIAAQLNHKDRPQDVEIDCVAAARITSLGEAPALCVLFVLFQDGSVSLLLEQGDALSETHRQQAVEAHCTVMKGMRSKSADDSTPRVPIWPRKTYQFSDYWLRECGDWTKGQ